MRLSVMLPVAVPAGAFTDEVAGMFGAAGLTRVYQGEALVECPFTQLDRWAQGGLACGVSVAVMPLRHPVATALQAAAISSRSGARFVLGIGPGAPQTQEALLGAPYRRPLSAVAGYVQALRTALGQSSGEGGPGTPPAMPLPTTMAGPADVEIGLGVLRPRMARLAGQVADAVIAHAPPPAYVQEVIAPAAAGGARDSCRRSRPRIAVVLPVGYADLLGGTEALARAHALHMLAPHYRAMYEEAGVLGGVSHPQAAVDRLIEAGAVAYGDPDDIGRTLSDLGRAGVDEVIVNTSATYLARGPEAAAETVRRMLVTGPPEPSQRRPEPPAQHVGGPAL